jgi:hypothetical protein
MGADNSEGEGNEGDDIKERRVKGLVIFLVQDETMALHVGCVHEVFVLVIFGTALQLVCDYFGVHPSM